MNDAPNNTKQSSPVAAIERLAPDFEARSTQGEIRLSDYRGRWLVFFSHPADFTPVCTSEFIAFQKASDRFQALNCALLGLSVDSLYAHIAWIKDVEERFGTKITFPIIEDVSMAVGKLYGMVDQDAATTATVRSVYVIDPEGYVRIIVHYPMNVGRSVEEILRVLTALQQADCHEIATPEGWRPGEPAVLPPPTDQAEAETRNNASGDAWYLTHTTVPSRDSHET